MSVPRYHFFHVFDGVGLDGGDDVRHPVEDDVLVGCCGERRVRVRLSRVGIYYYHIIIILLSGGHRGSTV